MIEPNTSSELLLFSTVRIQTKDKEGKIHIGTGFCFKFKADDQSSIPTIITNKHVINNAMTGEFLLHEAKSDNDKTRPSGDFIKVALDKFEDRWIPHPNEKIDLCAMPIAPISNEVKKQGKTIFSIYLDESIILSNEELAKLDVIEDIIMLGYPIGLWDETNNLPLIRKGITATHPAIDFNGSSEGIVDIACFPGSSGSPIFIFNKGIYAVKSEGSVVGSRLILLGVLWGGPTFNALGELVPEQIPTLLVPKPITPVMIHLGYLVKAKAILQMGEFLRHKFGFVK